MTCDQAVARVRTARTLASATVWRTCSASYRAALALRSTAGAGFTDLVCPGRSAVGVKPWRTSEARPGGGSFSS